ncbi:hypothetical protein VTK73DRAFT_425 [Phialemonium thermophilum]|uniref:Uncharacterized protein n=1 Tax=Phialemonium thermophilum TaxID=223376 RepID=A0ABR3VV99_9PEZI
MTVETSGSTIPRFFFFFDLAYQQLPCSFSLLAPEYVPNVVAARDAGLGVAFTSCGSKDLAAHGQVAPTLHEPPGFAVHCPRVHRERRPTTDTLLAQRRCHHRDTPHVGWSLEVEEEQNPLWLGRMTFRAGWWNLFLSMMHASEETVHRPRAR